jgi:hypothetical protein
VLHTWVRKSDELTALSCPFIDRHLPLTSCSAADEVFLRFRLVVVVGKQWSDSLLMALAMRRGVFRFKRLEIYDAFKCTLVGLNGNLMHLHNSPLALPFLSPLASLSMPKSPDDKFENIYVRHPRDRVPRDCFGEEIFHADFPSPPQTAPRLRMFRADE